jgi:hypothetical protein
MECQWPNYSVQSVKGVLSYLLKISKSIRSFFKTDLPLNIQIFLLMTLAAETNIAEGQLRRLGLTLSKANCVRFGLDTRKATVAKRVGQHFETL